MKVEDKANANRLRKLPKLRELSCEKSSDIHWKGVGRRKIRLIEGNAKCRHLKKFTCKGTLRQVFICLRSPPPYTLYIRVCSILIHKGTGGGGES